MASHISHINVKHTAARHGGTPLQSQNLGGEDNEDHKFTVNLSYTASWRLARASGDWQPYCFPVFEVKPFPHLSARAEHCPLSALFSPHFWSPAKAAKYWS